MKSCTGFSVDFSNSSFPESYTFSFSGKKLPLEALGMSVSDLLNFCHFYQKCRLGPPESEGQLRIGCSKSIIPGFRVKKQ